MSDLLELIRKTQTLYNHLTPAEAEILGDLTAAVHDLQEQRDGLLLWQRARLEIHDMLNAEIEKLRAELTSVKYHYDALSNAYDAAQKQLVKQQPMRDALIDACMTLQAFLDTFGDLGGRTTQADLNDWLEAAGDPLTDEQRGES